MHILCISGSQACLCITITWEAFLVDPDPPPTDLISLAWGKTLAIFFFKVPSDGCMCSQGCELSPIWGMFRNRMCNRYGEQTLKNIGAQRSLACCSPWGCRVRHNLATEQQQQSVT